jgi:phthalate 4,5-dioxygenase oxygenase subunit
VQFRRLMVAAAKKFSETGAVIGERSVPHVQLASYEGVVPKATDWRTLGAPPEESLATAK